jgi:hypothetical protein
MAGAFLVVSISAYYVLRGRHGEFARTSMKIGLVFATMATLRMVSEDFTARGVVCGKNIRGVRGEPCREVDRGINASVESKGAPCTEGRLVLPQADQHFLGYAEILREQVGGAWPSQSVMLKVPNSEK